MSISKINSVMNLTLMENFENKTIDYCQVHKWIFTDVIFNIILMLYYFDCFCDIVPKIKTMICRVFNSYYSAPHWYALIKLLCYLMHRRLYAMNKFIVNFINQYLIFNTWDIRDSEHLHIDTTFNINHLPIWFRFSEYVAIFGLRGINNYQIWNKLF